MPLGLRENRHGAPGSNWSMRVATDFAANLRGSSMIIFVAQPWFVHQPRQYGRFSGIGRSLQDDTDWPCKLFLQFTQYFKYREQLKSGLMLCETLFCFKKCVLSLKCLQFQDRVPMQCCSPNSSRNGNEPIRFWTIKHVGQWIIYWNIAQFNPTGIKHFHISVCERDLIPTLTCFNNQKSWEFFPRQHVPKTSNPIWNATQCHRQNPMSLVVNFGCVFRPNQSY